LRCGLCSRAEVRCGEHPCERKRPASGLRACPANVDERCCFAKVAAVRPLVIHRNAQASQMPIRNATIITLIVIAMAAVVVFRDAGKWLIREDPLSHADAIVVLSGSMPARAEEAAKIFQMGYAPEVWLTRPNSAAAELEKMNITYTGEEKYNREVLIQKGVSPNALRILPDAIVDTEQEIEEVSRQLGAEKKNSAIIVTSPQHTRRVRVLWRRLAQPGQAAVVRAAWEDNFDADHWWSNTRDAFAVSREVLGLMNAWGGLPVRPNGN
jgi:uncharacterized SAM-binding protein YcdF (DUF218 family)